MENLLCTIDKQPGVQPLRIGCILQRLMTKCALKAGGANAYVAYVSKQLCAILEASIKLAINLVLETLGESVTIDVWEWEVNNSIWLREAS